MAPDLSTASRGPATVSGPGFEVELCPGAVSAIVDSRLPSYNTVPALFELSSVGAGVGAPGG